MRTIFGLCYLKKLAIPVFATVSIGLSAPSIAALDLLELPAISSQRLPQSLVLATLPSYVPSSLSDLSGSAPSSILAVGERGHIFNWQVQRWQQHQVPVSVTLTGLTQLSNGVKIAVGHQSVILTSAQNSDKWVKVFDGHQLVTLKITALTNQISALETQLAEETDPDEAEELSYQLEDLAFSLQDLKAKKGGSDNPLLSITRTNNDLLFATGAYGTLLMSTDFGQHWQLISQRLANPEQFHLNQIVATKNKLFVVGENGLGFSSIDQGQHWRPMALPYRGSLFGLISAGGSNLVAFGLQGNVMISIDNGISWQHQKLATSASLLGGVMAKQRVYLVGQGGLVVDFKLEEFNQPRLRYHASGATLVAVTAMQDTLVLAGQYGIAKINY